MKKISILGSTGSIGLSTLEIVRKHPDRFKVVGLAGGSRVEELAKQASEFKPLVVSVKAEGDIQKLRGFPGMEKIEILSGTSGAAAVASLREADLVISAIVGAAGLLPTLAALKAGKTVGLANKESMVIAGELMRKAAEDSGATILPIDSEHSALFQCLQGHRVEDVKKLILTASGGPFLSKSDFSQITIEEALNHPNWSMGEKITIDSATMMNKGLEVMEARWLFGLSVDKIDVLVHPQSIIHSMVEYIDGSTLAQMGVPDMKVPIAYAMSYPGRVETGAAPLDLAKIGKLTFLAPDFVKFPCLKTAFEVARMGKSYPAVLNAANEEAVDAFLRGKISFVKIHDCVKTTLDAHVSYPIDSLEEVIEADRWAREAAHL